MKKPGFPPTTIALVVIMLGALFMVSKTVTPPPAAPPPVTPASATTPAAPQADPGHGKPGHVHGEHEDHDTKKPDETTPTPDMKKQKDQMEQAYRKKMEEEKKKQAIEASVQAAAEKKISVTQAGSTKPLKYDPSNNNIDSKFFTEMPMGDSGIKATDQAVAQAEAIKAKMRQTQATKAPAPPKSEQMKQASP